MKVEILEETNDTVGFHNRPVAIRITASNGESIEIRVENESNGYFQYSAYLDYDE